MKLMKLFYISLFVFLICSQIGFTKRRGPKSVKPVIYNGIKYTAIHWGKSSGLDQNGGYIEAFNVSSGKRLWILRVYKIYYIKNLEQDVQDVFITSMKIKTGNLIVTNERDELYKVNLKTKKVSKLKR